MDSQQEPKKYISLYYKSGLISGVFILAVVLTLILSNQAAIAPSPDTNLTLPVASSRPPKNTLLAVGDIMLSRNVSTKIKQAQDPLLPFVNLSQMISAADIAFGNLECPLDPGEIRVSEGLVFRCLTKDTSGLTSVGFDVLSTANNHSFDRGVKGVDFILDYLESQGILPVGTNKPTQEPDSVISPGKIIEKNNIKFGLLAYSYTAYNDGGKSTHPQIATMNDTDKLRSDIEQLKKNVDVVIVHMHAGTEYTRHPNEMQKNFAHAAIDSGADLVIGEHPHWIQDIEIYQDKPIFYSLGNFVFDQMWSQETREGLVVQFNFENTTLKSAKLTPVVIDNYCCPRIANDTEKQSILEKINQPSDLISFID